MAGGNPGTLAPGNPGTLAGSKNVSELYLKLTACSFFLRENLYLFIFFQQKSHELLMHF